jgi:RNA polymerase sigma-70 factor (ECF subfamily)
LPNFREDSKLYTWLYRIATNEALSFLKKKKKHIFQSIDTVSYQLESQIDASFFTGTEIEKKLQKAILTLPTKQRLIFNMKYFDEMKYDEISEILGTSVGALKASYHHSKQKIEKYLTTD